jgi:nucleoside recognition membrane protein YjiH
MAALSRFISWLSEKGLPFFKLLKAKEKFEWSEEANITFAELKQFLTCPLVLTALKEGKICCFTLRPPIG